MKKILISLAIIIISSASLYANIYFDGYGVGVDQGDAELQMGFGGAFGIDITEDVKFLYRGILSSKTLDANEVDEEEYESFTHLFGVEYVYPINRFGWKSSVMAGVNMLSARMKINDSEFEETGACFGIWTGVKYDFTQHISPFFDIGWQYSNFSADFKDESITGFHIMAGVRIAVFGQKEIGEGY